MTKQEMQDRHISGQTYAEIGAAAGISGQAVHKRIAPPQAVRTYVTKRAGNKCEYCGVRVAYNTAHVHQDGQRGLEDYSDLDRLMLLCPSCHNAQHG
jgi:5-methylcytosine-specific restriction endonuclease McrA